MTASCPRWYVVQTQSHAENRAATHLGRQGFTTYLPRYLKRRRHARRVEMVEAPLFPRYLFVSIDIEGQRWRSIQSTVGVAKLVCTGDMPASVSEGVVNALKARESDHGLIQMDQRPRFAPGEKVCIIEGAFASCFGLFEGMSDKERVAVLLDMLGRKVRVVLDEVSIAAA